MVTLQMRLRAAAHEGRCTAGSGNSVGALLADVGKLHHNLMQLVEGVPDDLSASVVLRSARQYARAISRYRKALLELLPVSQLARPAGTEASLRPRCRGTLWHRKPHSTPEAAALSNRRS